jgi:Short C-terminal domain
VTDGEATSRRLLPAAIVLVATLIGFASVFAIWVKRQALETETWTDTSSELLENEEIRDAIADFLVAQLYDNVDVEGEIADQLPPPADRLAGPVAAGLRQVADEAARRALARPEVQTLWEEANEAAHERLLAVIDEEAPALSEDNGAVNLDLATVLQQITDELGVGGNLAAKIPDDAAQLRVMDADDLDSIRSGVDLLRTLAWLLLAITLALYGLALYLAGDRRRETLRMIGFSFIVVGGLTLLAQRISGDAVVGALTDTAASEGPVEATWEIGTSLLTDSGSAAIAYGVVIVFAAWLAGPTRAATAIRAWLTPYLRQPRVAYAGLAALLLLLFWWDPFPATHRLAPSLLLIALLVIGVEVLRRQVIREFPDRFTTSSPGGVAVRMADQMRAARQRRVAPAEGAAAPAPEDARIADLERLAKLRDDGVLSADEFEAEKRRLIEGV